ncbi:MAG: RDD family protein [Paracoccaceae bacterium]
MISTDTQTGFPNPRTHSTLYDQIPKRRLFAFVIDSIIIVVLSLILIPFTAFSAIFFFSFFSLVVGVVYRTLTLAQKSATPGMRIMKIEFRTHLGERLSFNNALVTTLLFTASLWMVMPLLISAVMIVVSQRARGLSDLVMGTAVINRAAL